MQSVVFSKTFARDHTQVNKRTSVNSFCVLWAFSLTSLSLSAKKPSFCVLTDTLARSGRATLAFTWPVFWSASSTFFFVSSRMRLAPCRQHATRRYACIPIEFGNVREGGSGKSSGNMLGCTKAFTRRPPAEIFPGTKKSTAARYFLLCRWPC